MDEIKIPSEVTELVAKEFKNASNDELKQFVQSIKSPVQTYLRKLGNASFEINFEYSIFNQMKSFISGNYRQQNVQDVFSQVKENTGKVSFNQFGIKDTSVLLSNLENTNRLLDEKLELAKEGYELMNTIANAIHGYEMQYEVFVAAATQGIRVSNNLIAFRLGAPIFMSQLGWRKDSKGNFLSNALGFSNIENTGTSRESIGSASEKFISTFGELEKKGIKDVKQIINLIGKRGTGFDKMISYNKRNHLGGGIGLNFERFRKLQERVRYGGGPNNQITQEDTAFYRGPDYWAFINGQWVAIQAKAYNASISLSSITGGLNRLIFMISTIEGLLNPEIEQQVKNNLGKTTINTNDLINELVQSVFF